MKLLATSQKSIGIQAKETRQRMNLPIEGVTKLLVALGDTIGGLLQNRTLSAASLAVDGGWCFPHFCGHAVQIWNCNLNIYVCVEFPRWR